MILGFKNIDELIDIALKTTSFDEMLFLTKHPSMIVRRSLAKNININQDILNNLINDPVLNVSYVANKNPNNKNFRFLFDDVQRPCVICEKEEKDLVCENCDHVKDHNF
jgi:hypothetical protein